MRSMPIVKKSFGGKKTAATCEASGKLYGLCLEPSGCRSFISATAQKLNHCEFELFKQKSLSTVFPLLDELVLLMSPVK